jgi:uncharacterized protein YndB with AHSA1/START domain
MNAATLRDDVIVQEVIIQAPAMRIFAALTQPEELMKWWAAQGKFQVIHAESDFRLGGKWRMRVKGNSGNESVVAGEYREIDPPHTLAYTWVREQEDAQETLVRWELEESGAVTRVRVVHSGLLSDALRARNSGWPIIVGSLQAYLENASNSAPKNPTDFRLPTASKWAAPRAVADGVGGTIIATVELEASPARVFLALTTDEVERWWGHADFYRMTEWSADLRVCGQWRVTVRFADGALNGGSGEFAEITEPHKIVMTRRFDDHPLLGTRETTITYRLEPIEAGTRLTVRDEVFVDRSEAAYGNAEHWERVLGWLKSYISSEVHKGGGGCAGNS